MANRLYVIGNGFDLAHGMPCRYQDFKRYCQEYNEEMYRHIDRFYTDTDKLWSDFEAELPNIDERSLFCWATALNPEWNQDWKDYYRFVDTVKDEVDYLQWLTFAFKEWILSIDISKVPSLFKINHENALFLTFNYTEVLEKVYHIPSSIVNHIHGIAKNNFSSLIVGHNKTDYEINDMFDSDNDIELEACKEVKDLVRGWRKNTDSIIHRNACFFDSLHDVTEIFVLGHSMANVDMPYFHEIKANVQPDAMWTLSIYSQVDKQRKNEAIQELQLQDENVHFIELDDLSTQGRLNFEN